MRDRGYAELVKDLRCHAGTCEYKETECSRYNKRFDDTDYTTCSEELCDDAADAIEELLAAVPHWISVVERLPEKHKSVLFYIPWNKTNMIGWIDEGGGINLEGYGKCYDFSLIKPSYWMPLPKAPEEVE